MSSVGPIADYATVACCMCSASIQPNPTNMCVQCIRTTVDITEGIATKPTMYQCRGCLRWLKPGWVKADYESRELMAICLRKVQGLGKVKLVDASWIWTEIHSRRLKLKLTVQKEVINGAILQQSFAVEFSVKNQQCVDCQALYTNSTWKAVVQVRQRVEHKRTFFHLEQLLLKHNAHQYAINVQGHKDGIDFFYGEQNNAARMISFLENVTPCRTKSSKKLVGADNHSNTYNFHYSYLVTIVPMCKDDLVLLPKKLAETMGQFPRVCLVQRVNSNVILVDPFSAQTAEANIEHCGRHAIRVLLDGKRLTKFTVLGIEPALPVRKATMPHRRRMRKARMAEVTLARERDLGKNDETVVAMTHLGHLLKTGDSVLGYHLTNENLDEEVGDFVSSPFRDVILVRKTYSHDKGRFWKLDEFEKDAEVELNRRERENVERDYERYMQQVEADRELRKQISVLPVAEGSIGEGESEDESDEERIKREEVFSDEQTEEDESEIVTSMRKNFNILRFDDDSEDEDEQKESKGDGLEGVGGDV